MLTTEREYYDENLTDWLQHHSGRVVLVKGRQLIGFFDTEDEALAEGARLFGLDSFLVRRVAAAPARPSVPALTLGILRGNPA